MVNAGDVRRAPPGWALSRRRRTTKLGRKLALTLAMFGPSLAAPPAAWSSPSASATSSPSNLIAGVESSADGQATTIRVRGSRKARFTVQRLERPARVVVDVPDSHLAPTLRVEGNRNGANWGVNSWAVSRVGAHEDGRAGVQVVVFLARPASYRVSTVGNDLVVLLVAAQPAPAKGPAEDDEAEAEDEDEEAVASESEAPADRPAVDKPAPTAAQKPIGTAAQIAAAERLAAARRVEAARAQHKARQARSVANKAVRKRWRNSLRLRKVARKAEAEAESRKLRADAAEAEVARLRGEAPAPIAAATPAAPDRAPAPAAPAVAKPAAPAPDAAKPAAPPPAPARTAAASPARPAPPARPNPTDYPPPEVASYGSSSAPITQQSVSQIQQRRRKVYRGRKIDLDLKDADIHNLMRLLADVGGVNIVVPDDVKASITVRLRDVPWDQAMEVILASKGMWYRREGGLIRVAPRKELDAEDQAEAERMRALAESEAPETQVFTLNYSEAGKVREQLVPLLSPKGRIEVDERTNSLIINDISAHRRRIIGLVTQLDYQTPQIQIEARIVEARTTFTREFGIQWGGSVNASAAGGNSTGLVFPNSVSAGGGADSAGTPTGGVVAPSDFAVNLPAAVGLGAGGAIGLSLGSVGGNVNLNLRLSAAEDSGTVRIISAPRITTSNNIEASIKSGVSIPISVISANGVQTQFVPADLLLRVTPSVSQRDCAVSMQVNVTKNEADFVNTGARGDPSILTKEAKTTILVADGQTAVIGGIYTRNTGVAYSKVPFFADIPVLGWFFKNRQENDDRSEVLVFITPKITNRAFLRCQ
jgi:type IV pilus assembly protein PilQ